MESTTRVGWQSPRLQQVRMWSVGAETKQGKDNRKAFSLLEGLKYTGTFYKIPLPLLPALK